MAESGIKRNIPIKLGDFSVIDTEFSSIRERFDAEMRKMEEEMSRFRSELMNRESNFFTKSTTSTKVVVYKALNGILLNMPLNMPKHITFMIGKKVTCEISSPSQQIRFALDPFGARQIYYYSSSHQHVQLRENKASSWTTIIPTATVYYDCSQGARRERSKRKRKKYVIKP
ncbi:hypothetical protein L9F63_021484, partial [Diploptera punctata]